MFRKIHSPTKQSIRLILMAMGLIGIQSWGSRLTAQTVASREFMQASSPLKKGGVVVTRTTPGMTLETLIYSSPTGSSGTVPTSMSVGSAPSQPGTSISGNHATSPPPTNGMVGGSGSAQPGYAYPGTSPGPSGIPVPPTTVPSLGALQASSQKPYWFGQPAAPTVAGYPTTVAGYPPSMATTSPPSVGNPQSVYSPVPPSTVHYQNMKPGSYMGQGILGQPKAYIDGQPVRNLFRYLSVF